MTARRGGNRKPGGGGWGVETKRAVVAGHSTCGCGWVCFSLAWKMCGCIMLGVEVYIETYSSLATFLLLAKGAADV